jgi:hypothetical protein
VIVSANSVFEIRYRMFVFSLMAPHYFFAVRLL